ncbi:MAG: sensor histidine kinase [Myxococcota bacterium]
MRYPAFVEEMGRPENRSQLWMGVWSGYALAGVFALLALAGHTTGVVPHPEGLYALVLLKLATNTLALWSLRNEMLALEIGGLNVAMDVIAMTGAIYLTGGALSPLFAIYVIEVAVIALLTNLGTTLAIAVFAWVLHGATTVLAHLHVIPSFPPPATGPVELTAPQVALALAYALFVIGVPTLFLSAILRLLRRKERELARKNAALVDAARQKSWFMANVTHELRTPIHGIVGLSDLVRSGVYGTVTDKQRAAHQDIKGSAKDLLKLIDDLLALAQADAGKLQVDAAPVVVDDVCEAAMRTVRPMLGTRTLHLECDVEPGLELVSDRGKLVQVLVNLLSNALKFTPDGGRVTLRARGVDGGVTFEVRDTGIGIPEEERPRVFEAFRQVDGSDEREYGGVGLGLSMVHRLVTLLGGEVRIESTVGAGTVFTVHFPFAARRDEDPRPPPATDA